MKYSINYLAVRSSPLGKSMKKTCRSILVISVLIIYCTIFLIPFATKVTDFKGVAVRFAEKCSGCCSMCGCAPERSAARACCCWQNKLHNRPVKEKHAADDCYKKTQTPFSVTNCSTLPGGCGKFIGEWCGKSLECIVESGYFDTTCFQAEKQYHTALLDYSDWKAEPPDPPPETSS